MYLHPRAIWLFPDELRRQRAVAFAAGVLTGIAAGAVAFLIGTAA